MKRLSIVMTLICLLVSCQKTFNEGPELLMSGSSPCTYDNPPLIDIPIDSQPSTPVIQEPEPVYLAEYGSKNVISVTTVFNQYTGTQLTGNTGLAFDYKTNELLIFCTPNPAQDHRRDLSTMQATRPIPNVGNQGVAFNSETREYYMLWTTGIVVKDSTGKVKDTLKFPSIQPNPGMINYQDGKFFVSYDKGNVVNIWEGSPLRLTQISAPGADEGAAPTPDGKYIWYNGIYEKVKIDYSGNVIMRFTFKGGYTGAVNEGLIVLPDGCLAFNSDEGYHVKNMPTGNRTWIIDPEKTHKHSVH